MKYIKEIIKELLEDNSPDAIAKVAGVSTAMVSTWKNKANDYCPRLQTAANLYKEYGYITYPYSEEALKGFK